jgi:hypothetical protein
MAFLPDSSLDGFSTSRNDTAKLIMLKRCDRCGNCYSSSGACCNREPIALLPPAQPILLPPSPLDHHTWYAPDDEMWGHMLGGG